MKREACIQTVKLRVPPSWWSELEAWAARERRKPTQLLRNIIEDALKAHEREAA